MRVAMLYRARELLGDGTEYEMFTLTLFVRAEIIETNYDDLESGLDHVKERPGEEFINCVAAE